MKAPMFMLTKHEQRIVIFIMMVLVAAAMANRYRDMHPRIAPTKEQPVGATATPFPSTDDDKGSGD
ncbi:MAG: hypothetical protein QOH39_1733 [Verrucomicrobiota bacterium]|jgi:hypothetical protein